MDNQHRKIKGYRELTQAELDLMNRIKLHAQLTEELLAEVVLLNKARFVPPLADAFDDADQARSDSARWAAIARTDLQKGFMVLVRSVALPQGF